MPMHLNNIEGLKIYFYNLQLVSRTDEVGEVINTSHEPRARAKSSTDPKCTVKLQLKVGVA